MNPIPPTTTRALMAPLIVDLIPQLDLKHNLKQLEGWKQKTEKRQGATVNADGYLIKWREE